VNEVSDCTYISNKSKIGLCLEFDGKLFFLRKFFVLMTMQYSIEKDKVAIEKSI